MGPIKGLGFAMHRTAKLEELKAETFGTTASLKGTTFIKIDNDIKMEVKDEMKKETIKRDDDDTASVVDGVVEARLLDELDGQSVAGGLKRSRDRSDGKKRSKSEKKRAKKTKKAEKKVKKAAKKEKKA